MKTLYEILQVAEDATADEIKAAFKRLAKEHHPDRHGSDKGRETIFKQIASAKAVLSDPEQRREYDAQLQVEREAAQAAMRARAEKEAEEARARVLRSNVGAIVGGAAGVLGAGLLYAMYRAVSGGGQTERREEREERVGWDPYAERYHGSDGRFYPEP